MKCKIGKGKKLLKTMTEKYYKLKQHTINIHYVNHVLLNAAVRILVYTFCHSKCKVAEGIYIVSQKIIKFQETLTVVFASLFIVCLLFLIKRYSGWIHFLRLHCNPVFWTSCFKPGYKVSKFPNTSI